MRNDRLHKLNRTATWLIAGMAVANVGWLIAARSTWNEIVFRGLQYVAMLLIMYLPHHWAVSHMEYQHTRWPPPTQLLKTAAFTEILHV